MSASGNILEWFDDEARANAVFQSMDAECKAGGGWVALIGFSKDGLAVDGEESS